jgi:hypothetical protein
LLQEIIFREELMLVTKFLRSQKVYGGLRPGFLGFLEVFIARLLEL